MTVVAMGDCSSLVEGVEFLNAEDTTAESEDEDTEKLEDGESETPENTETKGRTGS